MQLIIVLCEEPKYFSIPHKDNTASTNSSGIARAINALFYLQCLASSDTGATSSPRCSATWSDAELVVDDIGAKDGGSAAASFDQQFYLILDLAVCGTSGCFPDGIGDKPWRET